MFRKWVFLMLICVLIAGTAALAESANSGTCGENLTWVLDDDGTLTISGTGDMTDFGTHVYNDWDTDKVKTVVIEAGVTSIGNTAFKWCDNVKSVVIPDTVTRIGDYAFWTCDLITEVTIPGSVKEIGDDAFRECSSLKTVTLNQGLLRIGKHAFERTDIRSIIVPDGVTYIGDGAFNECKKLEEVILPDSLTRIGSKILSGCPVKEMPAIVKRLEEANDLRLRDRTLAHLAIDFAADEIGRAAEMLNVTEDPDQRGWLTELTGCDYLVPLKVQIFTPDEDGIATLRTVTMAETDLDIPTALAEIINQPAGETYMQLAKTLSVETVNGKSVYTYKGRNCMVLLSYDKWHFVLGIYPSVTDNNKLDARGAFVSEANAVAKLFSQLGLELWSTYEGEAVEELIYDGGVWKNDTALMRAVSRSPDRLLTLFPRLLQESRIDNDMRLSILRDYLRQYPAYHAKALRTIRSYILLLYDDYRMAYYSFTRDIYEGIKPSNYEADDSFLGDELVETALKPDGTFRIIARVEDKYWKSSSSKNQVSCWEDFVLEALMPTSCLPDSAESCDYIIYLNTTWSDEQKITGGGAVLYYPTTRITVHDAKTGVMLKDAGSRTYKFAGTKMVRQSVTYWEPDSNRVLQDITDMLRKEGIEYAYQ